jgi:formiminoglutamase
LVSIDSRFSVTTNGGKSQLINRLLEHKPTLISHFTGVGFQTYLINPAVLQWLDQYHFDYIRLGAVRASIEEAEPILRFADILNFNMRSMRSSEAPATENDSPAGFFLEDACRMFRYAGLSENLSSLVVSGIK